MIIAAQNTLALLQRAWLNGSLGYVYAATMQHGSSTPKHLRDYNGFVPMTAPSAYRTERGMFITPHTHYGRGVGLNTTGEVLHNRESEMCGMCARSFTSHSEECERDFGSEFGDFVNDYYQYGPVDYDRNPVAHIVPYEDFSGYPEDEESEEFYRDSEWQEEFDAEGGYERQDFYWRDGNERECTEVLVDVVFDKANSVRGTAVNGSHGFPLPASMYIDTSAIEAVARTDYTLNNEQGDKVGSYHTVALLNPMLTAKSHAKMLNVYRKDGVLRIGGLQLFPSQEAEPDFPGMVWTRVVARCGHNACRYQDARRNWRNAEFVLEGYELTREQMEDFTYSLIRHGNNHAAPWFTDRTTARASHSIVEHSSPVKVGTQYILDPQVLDGVEVLYREVGVYAKEFSHSVTPKSPWRIEIPKDSPTFYKLHQHTCDLSCDPRAVVCK